MLTSLTVADPNIDFASIDTPFPALALVLSSTHTTLADNRPRAAGSAPPHHIVLEATRIARQPSPDSPAVYALALTAAQ